MDTNQPKPDLAVTITTCDNMRTIERTLRSIEPICSRIVVIDSGSTDGTIETCRAFGAEVIRREWPGFAAQKQFALDQCRDHRWVLLLDADESIEEALRESMKQALTDDRDETIGWWINRKVWFLDGWLHHTFQPEWVLRLVRGGRARMTGRHADGSFDPHQVHERLEVDGRTDRLAGTMRHDSWADLSDMCRRQLAYAELAGRTYERGGSIGNFLFSPTAVLLKQLVLKRCYRDGWRGVLAAGGAAAGTLLKHLFIAHRKHGYDGEQ